MNQWTVVQFSTEERFFSKVPQKPDLTVTCSISVTANDSNSLACQLHRPTLAQQLVPSTGNCGKTENDGTGPAFDGSSRTPPVLTGVLCCREASGALFYYRKSVNRTGCGKFPDGNMLLLNPTELRLRLSGPGLAHIFYGHLQHLCDEGGVIFTCTAHCCYGR